MVEKLACQSARLSPTTPNRQLKIVLVPAVSSGRQGARLSLLDVLEQLDRLMSRLCTRRTITQISQKHLALVALRSFSFCCLKTVWNEQTPGTLISRRSGLGGRSCLRQGPLHAHQMCTAHHLNLLGQRSPSRRAD